MMFGARVPASLSQNRLSAAVAAHRRGGRPLLDLTVSNPTTAGIDYPADLLASLALPEGRTYRPEPFGLGSAREAVVQDYARRGISVAVERIVLTASTSEAYSLLFKLLCAPSGDEVLVPVPSYPLFDHLTQLDGVGVQRYGLEYHGRWELDERSVDTAWNPRIQAVLAVSPNNPTGSVLAGPELAFLQARCAERNAALIVDEVFADYPLRDVPRNSSSGTPEALAFRLGGLSKSAGLPQVKLGWMAVDGPPALIEEALARLELICDTYLSVSTPVQVAAGDLIERGAAVREAILQRVRRNYASLQAAASTHPSVQVLEAEAGWTAVMRIPAREPEEDVVLSLLEQHETLVHPGFFFDLPHEAFLVISLLPPPDVFDEGCRRLLEHVDA